MGILSAIAIRNTTQLGSVIVGMHQRLLESVRTIQASTQHNSALSTVRAIASQTSTVF